MSRATSTGCSVNITKFGKMIIVLAGLLLLIATSFAPVRTFRPDVVGITHKTISASDLGPQSKSYHIDKVFPHLKNPNHKYSYPDHFPSRRTSYALPIDPSSTSPRDDDDDSVLITPTTYGADPTCINDSTIALEKSISVALSRVVINSTLADNIYDLGGVTIDLQGGCYMISSSLNIPGYYGNIRIIDGTIKANPNGFMNKNDIPKYLIIVGNKNISDSKACTNSQGSCNENIGFENLMFDCQHVADGGLYIRSVMGCVVGPQMFFLGFNEAGITVSGGHETMIFTAWFGEYLYSSNKKKDATGTGILLLGNDHYIDNTIVFSAKTGVYIQNPANILTGVHTWNLETELGGIGIYVNSGQTRLIGCYLDYNNLVIVNPQLISVEQTFFLGGGTVVLKANGDNAIIDGLTIIDSEYAIGNYAGTNQSTILIANGTINSKFKSVNNMYVSGIMIKDLNRFNVKSTKVKKSLSLKNSTKWEMDFSDKLLFTNENSFINIEWVQYTFVLDIDENDMTQFVSHNALKPNGMKVTVVTDAPCDGTVHMTVDQSTYSA